MFKHDIKKYQLFADCVANLRILAKVESELADNVSDLQVYQHKNVIYISPSHVDVDKMIVHCVKTDDEPVEPLSASAEMDTCEQSDYPDDSEVLEEYIEETAENLQFYEEEAEAKIIEIKSEPVIIEECSTSEKERSQEPVAKPKRLKMRKYKYPTNTNDKLTDEEKDWIVKQIHNSEVYRDGVLVYKCPLCDTFLQISASLKVGFLFV